jgi:predicted RNA binding protein YcfA (HicA-like mRNA interferase family)
VTRLPRLTGREMVVFLKARGFELLRIRGSHYFLEGNGKRTTVPVHGNRGLKTGTLRSILRDIDLSPGEFTRLWEGRPRRAPQP